MRKLTFMTSWPVCLMAIAAACSSPTEENDAAGDEAPNAAASEAGNAADANAAAPADNAAAGNAAAAEGEYRASGYEPGWAMVIDEQISFDSADGPDINVATPPQQPTRAGYSYATPELTVIVNTFTRCTAANGDVHHDTVQVMIGQQTFSGCGGAVTAAAE